MVAGFPHLFIASLSTFTALADVAESNRPYDTTNLDASSRYAMSHPFPSRYFQSVCHIELEYW